MSKAKNQISDSNRIIIFDTTLRDGEQSPGASMNLEEKLRIAHVLENMGVDVIEAGFPIASDGDFEAVSQIAKKIKDSTVCGLARATKMDIDRCAEAVKPAARPRIHTFISTSPLHMKHKLQMQPDQVLERINADRDYLSEEPMRLRGVVDEYIAPHFDFPRMSQWVLGKHWREASEDSQARFIDQFKNLLVRTYASALLEYSEQTISYHPVDVVEGVSVVTVRTDIVQTDAVPIPILYKMHNKDGDWKVFDVSVDGVSLISTYRASFASEIRKSGIDGLIATLQARNQKSAAVQ